MNSELTYSPEAYNVLPKFYHTDFIVYVEGPDDLPFWTSVFSLYTTKRFIIEPVGSCTQLDKKIKLILANKVNFIVARDSDYLFFSNSLINNPQIIYTYGYSIENMLYCKKNINRFLDIFYRTSFNFENDIENFGKKLIKDLEILIILDICSYKYQKSITILGDSLFKLLKNDKQYVIDSEKKQKYLDEIKKSFTEAEINDVSKQINNYERDCKNLLRGHCITSVLLNFIKFGLKKNYPLEDKQLSKESLYTSLIDGCKGCSLQKCCQEQIYLKNSVQNAISAIV